MCDLKQSFACVLSLGSLDMLILNHVGSSYFGFFNGDVGHVQKLLDINFLSYVTMTVAALPMLKNSGGNIVVVSSMAGEHELQLCAMALCDVQRLKATSNISVFFYICIAHSCKPVFKQVTFWTINPLSTWSLVILIREFWEL